MTLEDQIREVEKEIREVLSRSPVKMDPVHSETTRKWVLKLKPDADQALQIAALAHDIERSMLNKAQVASKEKFGNYERHKKEHSERSARIISNILKKHNFDKNFIRKVERLVLTHEFGGDKESDILKDADSLSFFESNLEDYFKRYGEEKTKFKIKFMFDRMSGKAKSIVRKFRFKNTKLESIFKEAISEKP